MGWVEAGKVPVKVDIIRPFHIISGMAKRVKHDHVSRSTRDMSYYLNHPNLDSLIKQNKRPSIIATNYTKEYFCWRYQNVPVTQYLAFGEVEGQQLVELAFGRQKQTRFGSELRFTDWLTRGEHRSEGVAMEIREYCRANHIDYITTSDFSPGVLGGWRLKLTRNGPVVTVRSLSMKDLGGLKQFQRWRPSLGDLELF
jgi:hypothetical protein